MARIDSLGNFLTDVADAIRTKKGTTDTIKASEFDTEITNLPSGGGSSSKMPMARMQFINSTKEENSATTVTYNISNFLQLSVGLGSIPPFSGIVFFFCRNDYTISDNLTLLAETDWFTNSGTNQKLVACWCNNLKESFTITQATAGRLGVGIIPLEHSNIPTVILNDSGALPSSYSVTTEDGLNIYVSASIFGGYVSKELMYGDFDSVMSGERLCGAVSYYTGTKTIPTDGSGAGVIGLSCSYKEDSE